MLIHRCAILMLFTAVVPVVRAEDRVGEAQEVADRVLQLATAHQHWQTGQYDAAGNAYRNALAGDELSPEERTNATIGLSRALESQGLWDLATDTVRKRIEQTPDVAALHGRLAELMFRQGDFDAATKSIDAALAIDEEHPTARLTQAHILAETGELDEALSEYRWFVRYYNRQQPTDAETLMLVAEGSLQYARWKSVSSIFNFVINTLCPDALKNDPNCWQAAHLSGVVLLEKYNRPQALTELEAALKINPNAAEVLTSLGDASLQDSAVDEALDFAKRALAINPRLPAALRLAAEVSLASGDLSATMTFVEQALAINPHDQRTLALQASVFLLEDGVPAAKALSELLSGERIEELRNDKSAGEGTRFAKLWRELIAASPKPGVFLARIGDTLDSRRKFAAAEVCYRRAIEVMPQLAAPRTELGMLLMRTGKLDEAAEMLEAAFKADPYHVRVSNMRKVMRQLDEYDVITSDHFVIRVPADQRILGEEMSRYLESIYDELTEQYGYEPETRTQFEVYGTASGQSAHQWFSARMVGLPWIQTIGASTGMIVAMASPYDLEEPFNWARVVRHEFVHILTLQQTDFNIPHWYTEALAVRSEGNTPESWDGLLLERVPAGEVFTLDDINTGFTRPEKPTDWDMAYCQSWLYSEYLVENYGEESLIKLVNSYQYGQSTEDAIADVCDVSLAEFERGYSEYLNDYVAEIRRTRVAPSPSLEVATARWKENSDDRDAWADVAWAMWQEGDKAKAREMAQEIYALDPRQPLAVAILAETQLDEEKTDEAAILLLPAFDGDNPHPAIFEQLLNLNIADKDWPAALDLAELALKNWPREPRFVRGLAVMLLHMNADLEGDEGRLVEALSTIAELDADDGLVRKKLATMAADAEDWPTAIHWAEEALHCDVRDVDMHRLLAKAYEQTGDSEAAARHTAYTERLEQSPER
ncbi:MAG: tetratricopeptide repeat protein [Planctomycetaceae bacterium]|nr:tetratricopeptide repeat protein [Planctomycetaceae bacterium]